jgi:hypothetical protein
MSLIAAIASRFGRTTPRQVEETHRGVGVSASPVHYQTIKGQSQFANKLRDRVLEIGAGFETLVKPLFAVADRVSNSVV